MTGISCVSIGFVVIQLNCRAGTKGGFHPAITVMCFLPQCMSHLCPLSSERLVVDSSPRREDVNPAVCHSARQGSFSLHCSHATFDSRSLPVYNKSEA